MVIRCSIDKSSGSSNDPRTSSIAMIESTRLQRMHSQPEGCKYSQYFIGAGVTLLATIIILAIVSVVMNIRITNGDDVIIVQVVNPSNFQFMFQVNHSLSRRVRNVLNEIASNINSSVDPCDDFYEYACGNFGKKYVLPMDRDEVTYYTLHADDVFYNITSKLDSSQFTSPNTPEPLKYLKRMWDSCVDDSSDDDSQLDKMKSYLRKVNQLDSWQSKFAHLTRNGYNMLFTVRIASHPFGYKAISVSSPDLEPIDGSMKNASPLLDFYSKMIQLYKNESTEENTVHLAQEIIEFEQLISSNITPVIDKGRNSLDTAVKIETLNQITAMNWTDLLKQVTRGVDTFERLSLLRDEDDVVIGDMAYIEKAKGIIYSKNESFLNEYLTFSVVRQSCFMLGRKCRNLYFKMIDTFQNYHCNVELKKRTCFDILNKYAEDLVYKAYDSRFWVHDEENVRNISEDLGNSLRNFIKGISWMDDVTKLKALRRSQFFTSYHGFDVKEPFYLISQDSLTEEYLNAPHFNSKEENIDFYDYVTGLMSFQKLKQLDCLLRSNWEVPLLSTAPHFAQYLEEFYVPAFFVQNQLYDPQLPKQMRFGLLGSTMAHEMVHVFDALADKFGEVRRANHFWSVPTRMKFYKQTQCFVDAYEKEGQEFKVNGTSTLIENLADLMGLHISYTASKNVTWSSVVNATEFPHPLKGMVDDRLFFLSYANVHCSNEAPNHPPLDVQLGIKSPRKLRVNLPLAHTDKFAQAFQCKPGTKMNPLLKCSYA